MPLHSRFEEQAMVLSVAVRHDQRAILVLSVLALELALAGCAGSIHIDPPPPAVSVSLLPNAVDVQILKTQLFTVTIHNDRQGQGVTWSLTQSGKSCAPDCGTMSGAARDQVTYAAPMNVPSPQAVTLTATSVADTTKSAFAIISVTPPPLPVTVHLSLTTAPVAVTQTQLFTVSLQNDTQNMGVTWGLTQSGNRCSPGCGTLSGVTADAATYNAPTAVPNPAIVTLTATSVADNTKSASATITITTSSHVFGATVKFCDDETENPNCTAKDTFNLAQIRDLFIWVNWQVVPTGEHTQQLDIFMPQGHALYVRYLGNFQITEAPTGTAVVLRPMPVAGTWITQRQLTGTWDVEVSLDGQLVTSKTFQFYSETQ
jgi:hypothetical protein